VLLVSESYQQAAANHTLKCYFGQRNSVGYDTVLSVTCSSAGGYCQVRK